MLSPRAVESFRSQKTTVTVLRTSCDGTGGASGVPQNPHSRNRSGFSSPQSGQMRTSSTLPGGGAPDKSARGRSFPRSRPFLATFRATPGGRSVEPVAP